MEQFNLDTWLKDKSRKVVTRSGHNVRILCTDQRGNMPIVALVEFETLDGVQIFYSDGKNESHREYDLFFADDEEKLTEFEEAMVSFAHTMFDHLLDKTKEVDIKEWKEKLLDLARKEILKDLPKWRKATKCKEFDKHVCVMDYYTFPFLDTEVNEGDYYIKLEDLKTLPKEE